jgi:hypothetical protein
MVKHKRRAKNAHESVVADDSNQSRRLTFFMLFHNDRVDFGLGRKKQNCPPLGQKLGAFFPNK